MRTRFTVYVLVCVASVFACGGESRRTIPNAAPSATTEPVPSACPPELLLEFGPAMAVGSLPSGITVEPLQVPDYSVAPGFPDAGVPYPTPDPATWDRSELHAGACVFRVTGLELGCYPKGGRFVTGSCSGLEDGRPLVSPASFYDDHQCDGVAPGCITADAWNGEPGAWWYFAPRDAGVTDLVVCAPACANSFYGYGGCLRLRPNALTCP